MLDRDLQCLWDGILKLFGGSFPMLLEPEPDGVIPTVEVTEDGDQRSILNINDVLEAISITDPTFEPGVEMEQARPHRPFVRIVEQPAGRALRFRYECEGRSAGSIPGVNSTNEKKTYPTIEVVGYIGSVLVVVSCVDKDKPHRPHPHKLVGRDPCKNGIYMTHFEVKEGHNRITFANLGIQCVKKKHIKDSLENREDQNVDPFRTGFAHKDQPQSIDVNVVRLCFQVFPYPVDKDRRTALPPVVSDLIYDKKAMCDLHICRVSHCSGTARGGTQMMMLCEKVTRDEIAVVFYEESAAGVEWEQHANIQLVHKQVAIVLETPAYRDHSAKAKVKVQLKRLSDNSRSNALDFEYIPAYQGTAKPPPDLLALAAMLDANNNRPARPAEPVAPPGGSPGAEPGAQHEGESDSSVALSEDSGSAIIADINGNVDSVELELREPNDKSLNELLDQVAELDEIYSESRTRLARAAPRRDSDASDFDDAGTYTSLQLAYRNPVPIAEPYDPASPEPPGLPCRGPVVEFRPLKSDDDDAPPLPPKRVRRPDFRSSQTSVDAVLRPGRPLPLAREPPEPLTREPSAARSELSAARSEPALPPAPKKRSFLSRIFRRKEKSPAPSVRSERAASQPRAARAVARSASAVAGPRPRLGGAASRASLREGLAAADSVTHISLHGDGSEPGRAEPAGPGGLPGGTVLVAQSVLALDAGSFARLQDELELTDAEHYALYMAVAPHATASEFDDASCYYSPVDTSRFLD